jgi:hypothetical protein
MNPPKSADITDIEFDDASTNSPILSQHLPLMP